MHDYGTMVSMLDQSAKKHEFQFTSDENPEVQLSRLEDTVPTFSTFGFKIDPPLVLAHFMCLLPSDCEHEVRVIKTTADDPKDPTRERVMRLL